MNERINVVAKPLGWFLFIQVNISDTTTPNVQNNEQTSLPVKFLYYSTDMKTDMNVM